MQGEVPKSDQLISELVRNDPSMSDIVSEFVAGLVGRVRELRSAHEQLDFARMAMLAHRLKGAGGSYGYPTISTLATEMERDFRAGRTSEFSRQIRALEQLAVAATAGLASSAPCSSTSS